MKRQTKFQRRMVPKHEWLQYFGDLRTSKEVEGIKVANANPFVDPIEGDELEEALRSLKNKNAPSNDGLNGELFKYGLINFKI